MEPNKKKAALFGGLLAGLVSGFGSIIPCFGCLCCLLSSLGGGALAAKVYGNEIGGRSMTPGEGATVGAMAGGVGAGIYLLIGIPLQLLWGAVSFATATDYEAQVPAELVGFFLGVGGKIVGALLIVGLCAAGGALGAALFKGSGGAPPSYPGGGGTYPPGGGQPPYGGGDSPYGGGGQSPYGGGQTY